MGLLSEIVRPETQIVSITKSDNKEKIMSEQQNTDLVQQAYENFKSGNIQALLSLISDDVEWQLPEVDGIPFTGKRRGLEQVAQFFAMVGDGQDVLQFEPGLFIAQGDKVAVQGHYSWLVKSTGRNYESDFAHVFTIREGKIVAFQEYLDTAVASAAYQKAQSA
jgi:ketosteroid isomerase-like protein